MTYETHIKIRMILKQKSCYVYKIYAKYLIETENICTFKVVVCPRYCILIIIIKKKI